MESQGGRISGVVARKEKLAEMGRNSVLPLEGRRFGRLLVEARAGSRWKKALWRCRCDCGREKVVSSRALVGGATRSCGCYRSEVLRKLRTNLFLTDEEREFQRERRVNPRTVEWRRLVYERDGYACQACGDGRGGNLVAHHKESWGGNKALRFDVGNGATSCEPCHKEFHSVFGYGGNTAGEWEKFVESKGVGGRRFERPVKSGPRTVNLEGRRFGRLVVEKLDTGMKPLRWMCRCDCGMVKSVDGHGLKKGVITSCGCLRKERAAEMGKANRRVV